MTDSRQPSYCEPKRKADVLFGRVLIITLAFIMLVSSAFLYYRNGYLNGKSGCNKPIISYFEAICQRDFDSYIEAMPYELRTDHQVQLNTLGFDKYDYLDTLYTDLFDTFGEDMSIKLKFLSVESDSYLTNNISRNFYEKYGYRSNIEDCCMVRLKAHFEGSLSSADKYINCTVVKLNGKWYIIDAANGSSNPYRAAYLT